MMLAVHVSGRPPEVGDPWTRQIAVEGVPLFKHLTRGGTHRGRHALQQVEEQPVGRAQQALRRDSSGEAAQAARAEARCEPRSTRWSTTIGMSSIRTGGRS